MSAPQGTEREARPPLRVRIAQAMAAHPGLGGLYSDHPDSYLTPHAGATADYVTEADAVLAVVELEIDRAARERDAEIQQLTAEAERLRNQVAGHKTEIERLEGNEEFLERAVHLLLGCCDGSDVPCEDRNAEVLYEHVRKGTTPRSCRALTGELAEAQRQARVWKSLHTAAALSRDELAAELKQAVEDWGRNDEQVLAENQRLAAERDEWKQAAEAEAALLNQEQAERRAAHSRLREQLAAATALADDLLMMFATGEKGHPGRPCVRTGWIDEAEIERLRERRAALDAAHEGNPDA